MARPRRPRNEKDLDTFLSEDLPAQLKRTLQEWAVEIVKECKLRAAGQTDLKDSTTGMSRVEQFWLIAVAGEISTVIHEAYREGFRQGSGEPL